jgi:hypothetical protein
LFRFWIEFRPMWPKCSVYHTIGLWGYLLEPSFSHLALHLDCFPCGPSAAYTVQSASEVIFCSCLFHILWLTRSSTHVAQVRRIPYNRPLGLSSDLAVYLNFGPCGPSTADTIPSASGALFWRLLFAQVVVYWSFGPCRPSAAYTIQSACGAIFWSLLFRISWCI